MKKFVEKVKDDNSTEPHARRIMEGATVDRKHRCWGWYEKHNNVCHLCRFASKCYNERKCHENRKVKK